MWFHNIWTCLIWLFQGFQNYLTNRLLWWKRKSSFQDCVKDYCYKQYVGLFVLEAWRCGKSYKRRALTFPPRSCFHDELFSLLILIKDIWLWQIEVRFSVTKPSEWKLGAPLWPVGPTHCVWCVYGVSLFGRVLETVRCSTKSLDELGLGGMTEKRITIYSFL